MHFSGVGALDQDQKAAGRKFFMKRANGLARPIVMYVQFQGNSYVKSNQIRLPSTKKCLKLLCSDFQQS